MQNNLDYMTKVRIIGAGPSGLVSLYSLAQLKNIDLKCYEANNQFGGNWSDIDTNNKYFDDVYLQNYGTTYQSVYESLSTNLPRLFMAFKDFPPKQHLLSTTFWSYTEYQSYVRDYVQNFNLDKFIQFNTFVEKVLLISSMNQEQKNKFNISTSNKEKFVIIFKTLDNSESQFDLADFVYVCNGRFSVPHIPNIKNFDQHKDMVIHSHSFRKKMLPEFSNKKILLVGMGPSGYEILDFLLKFKNPPKQIYVLIRKKFIFDGSINTTYFKEYVENKTLIFLNKSLKSLENNQTIVFDDDSKIEEISKVILCTGYQYTFPFLENQNFVNYLNENKKAFGPLYKKIFCINEPNLIFIGIQSLFISSQQKIAKVAAAVVSGKICLPNKEIMLKEYQQEINDVAQMDPSLQFYLYSFGFSKEQIQAYHNELATFLNISQDEQDLKFVSFISDFVGKVFLGYLSGDVLKLKQQNNEELGIPSNYEETYCKLQF